MMASTAATAANLVPIDMLRSPHHGRGCGLMKSRSLFPSLTAFDIAHNPGALVRHLSDIHLFEPTVLAYDLPAS
jgi:hypothetical protein